MAPNLSEEQQVIIVINFLMPTLLKGLHICYVPTTAYIDMCYKNIEEMKLNRVSAQNEVKILFQPYTFFHQIF